MGEGFSENILMELRKQVAPLVNQEVDRMAVATERLRLLNIRSESYSAQKAKMAEELVSLRKKLMDVDAFEDPGELNRQIISFESQIAGFEERIESLGKGGDAFLSARKEFEDARADLEMAIRRAIISSSANFEEDFNALIESAWSFYQGWESAVNALYYENGSYPKSSHALVIDRKRSDLIIR